MCVNGRGCVAGGCSGRFSRAQIHDGRAPLSPPPSCNLGGGLFGDRLAVKPRLLCEFPAGLAAFSLYLHGGKHCRPPISRQGSKAGYAEVLAATLGLRAGAGADCYWWAEADDDVRALLRAYPDAAMLRRIAEIIRGWADEEPRALWERLRAERKARVAVSVEEGVGGWLTVAAGSLGGVWGHGPTKFEEWGHNPKTGERFPGNPATALPDACHRLAEYAVIASANRLINVAGPDLVNTGAGGTTFGGAEFCTPAREVGERFEGMAREVAGFAFVAGNSWRGQGEHWRDPSDDVIAAGINVCRSAGGLAADLERAASAWPPVRITPRIPTAAEVAEALGTPGDLEGVVVYMDPPYVGTTGYTANLSRAEVVAHAIDFDRMGAVVCVSEAVPVEELTALGWYSADIGAGRKGQRRTFARVATEALTMNREPQHRVAVQAALFGMGGAA